MPEKVPTTLDFTGTEELAESHSGASFTMDK
jgi:hypothetical protein